MDTGKGYFETSKDDEAFDKFCQRMEGKHSELGAFFTTGEEVILRGSRFRIGTITPKKLVLRLLPAKPGVSDEVEEE